VRGLKAVIADAKGHGWEGVHIDNVDLRCFCDGRPREYPTERSYQKATESFIRFVYPRLHRAGLYVQMNVGNGGALESWRNTKTTCKKYVPYMDGYSQQSFMTNDSWRRQVHLIRCIQKQHKFKGLRDHRPHPQRRRCRCRSRRSRCRTDWPGRLRSSLG
jgi:hypothetical protein